MRQGDLVEDFELPDQHGQPRKLSDLLTDGQVVLFFYPAAMTSGCTAESCHFRDLSGEFDALGARPVGISRDPVEKQRSFAEANSFEFTLLADASGSVAEHFDVGRRFGPAPVKRHTFVIDRDRRVLRTIRSEFRMATHADTALAFLRERK